MESNPGWSMLKPEQTEPFIASSPQWKLVGESCYEKVEPFKHETNDADTERHQLSSLFTIRYTMNTKTKERTVIVDIISPNLQFMMEKALYGVETADFREPVTLVNFKTLFHKRTQLRMFRDVHSDHITAFLLDKEHFRCFIRIFEDLCEDLDNRLEALVRCDEITWEFLPELFLPKTKVLRNDGTNDIQDEGTCLECEETIDKEGLRFICLRISLDQGGDCSIFIPEFDSKVAIRSLEVYPKDFMED
ncbi:uncharacterized protein BKA55DRAFT_598571 [Fusarium redolens]|uniref:Uncharacterized protein n=1 Tax=Fusarium redolens TaxID=48865 RepID=A0A9P9G2L9_FUSRE|nr:uncharacterized protein BKA55DRAFT_598571 [Fusarium redolens]KAH7231288.1 hypothetical protein BKA55DRAFT_598571 [Fusarium redolens]